MKNKQNLERPEWIESVLQNTDGTVQSPIIEDNLFVCIFDLINGFAGLGVNLCFGMLILFNPRLRSQPVYLIHLSKVFGNTVALSADIVEGVNYLSPDAEEKLCHFVVSTFAFSFTTFFLNQLLSLIDRYILTIYPDWHRSKVSSTLFIIVVAGAIALINLLVALALNWVYISHLAPIRCALHVNHVAFARIFVSFIIVTFLLFFALFSVKISNLLKPATGGATDLNSPVPASLQAPAISITGEHDNNQIQLLKSTRKFLSSLVPLLLIPFLVIVVSLTSITCLNFYPNDDTCRLLVFVSTYDNKLLSFQAFLYPFITWYNDDLLSGS